MRAVEQAVGKRILLGRLHIAQHAGQQPQHSIHQHHGGQFAAGNHKVANADFFIDVLDKHALVYTFVAAANQNQVIQASQFADLLMVERPALRAQINGFAAACVLCTGFFDGGLQGRCHHNHARAAAKRAIIDVTQFVVGKAARVDGVELP